MAGDKKTIVDIETPDRLGLLYDLFTILGNLDAEVLNARISTQAGAAIDRFYLVDSKTEEKITDKERLAKIEAAISECLHLTRPELSRD